MKKYTTAVKYTIICGCFAALAAVAVLLVDGGKIPFASKDTPAREEFDYATDEKILQDLLDEGDVSAIEQNEYEKYVSSLPAVVGERAYEYVHGETVIAIDKKYADFADVPNVRMPAPTAEYSIPAGYTCTGAQDGILLLNRGGKFGYFLESGYWLTDPEFSEAYAFSGGVAVVKSGGRYGMVDKEGRMVVPAVFDAICDMDGSGITAYKRGSGYIRIVFIKS